MKNRALLLSEPHRPLPETVSGVCFSTYRRITRRLAIALVVALFGATLLTLTDSRPARLWQRRTTADRGAATLTWTGGGADGRWSNAAIDRTGCPLGGRHPCVSRAALRRIRH